VITSSRVQWNAAYVYVRLKADGTKKQRVTKKTKSKKPRCSENAVQVKRPRSQSWGHRRESMAGKIWERGRFWGESERARELRMVRVVSRQRQKMW